jgi:hypothetical protein
MTSVAERAATGSSEQEIKAIAIEGFVFLYPLLTMELTRRQMTNAPAGERPGFAPTGVFSHIRAFPRADFKAVVRPNFDTLYSAAWLDLRLEPMVVSVPDTHGRYYVMPFYDMWTDVFAAPGSRTSGTREDHYAIAPHGWGGEVPDGIGVIHSPTPSVWIIGRTQCNGTSDYPTVNQIQDGYRLTPLSQWGSDADEREFQADPSVHMETPPLDQVNAMSGRDYFTLSAELMKVHAPHVTDWSIIRRLGRVGLQPGATFQYETLDSVQREAIDAAPARGLALMQETLPRLAKVTNGWQMNTDTMGVYGNFYMKRAIVSMIGLGANQAEDAIYPLNVSDTDGQPVSGDNDYVLHFAADEIPPVGAFWSLTMYDEKGFQAANPIDRFAIGDRNDLRYNDDGSLDIYIQHDTPGGERESNWLPAPRGPLGLTMRLYAPAPQALDGRWNPPPIRRLT